MFDQTQQNQYQTVSIRYDLEYACNLMGQMFFGTLDFSIPARLKHTGQVKGKKMWIFLIANLDMNGDVDSNATVFVAHP